MDWIDWIGLIDCFSITMKFTRMPVELTSNITVSNIFLPIVATMAVSLGEHPIVLMAPCTIAASMAFMFPVATPPNAIVFSSGYLTVPIMARYGIVFNLLGIAIITAATLTIGPWVLAYSFGTVPPWALSAVSTTASQRS
jgi:solute carrier family 13 (sodium-dependent dicarboxylate transporter), member 2/3/5